MVLGQPVFRLVRPGTSIATPYYVEQLMTMIRVQYDAYNRQFTLLDGQSAGLHDGDTYLIMNFSTADLENDSALDDEDELAHS
jgi:hypothetical protein